MKNPPINYKAFQHGKGWVQIKGDYTRYVSERRSSTTFSFADALALTFKNPAIELVPVGIQ